MDMHSPQQGGREKETEAFQVRAELYSPARLPPQVYQLHRTRELVAEVVAQQCWLVALTLSRVRHTHEHAHDSSSSRGGPLPRVGVIGGGYMGCTIVMALLNHQFPADRIIMSTRQPERVPRCAALAEPLHQHWFQSVARVHDNARVSRECELLIVCVPPPQLKSVAIQIKHALGVADSGTVLLSVLCATPIETLRKACGTKLVVRSCVDVDDLGTRVAERGTFSDCSSNVKVPSMLQDFRATSKHDTLGIAVEHLGSRPDAVAVLAQVLQELVLRLDPSVTLSQAQESVSTVLYGATASGNNCDGESNRDEHETSSAPCGPRDSKPSSSSSLVIGDTGLAWPSIWGTHLELLQTRLSQAVQTQTREA